MKFHLIMKILVEDQDKKQEVLTQLIPATQKFEAALPPNVKVELTQISMDELKLDHNTTIDRNELDIINVGDMQINYSNRTVKVNDNNVAVTPTEFKLLSTLASRRGVVQSRETLLRDVWKVNPDNNTRTLDVHIKRLRDKLGTKNNVIQTIAKVGYIIK